MKLLHTELDGRGHTRFTVVVRRWELTTLTALVNHARRYTPRVETTVSLLEQLRQMNKDINHILKQ